MSWKDDKDLGPWDFVEQPDKWGYLNNPRWMRPPKLVIVETKYTDEEPQIWNLDDDYRGDSDKHSPCGHWHKIPTYGGPGGPSEVSGFEVYFELLNGSVSMPSLYSVTDLLGSNSFIPINQDDFDGDVDWYFEIIGFNSNTFDVTIQAVDDNGNVCATNTLAAGTVGPTGSELYRQRVDFTPTYSDDLGMYGLKIIIPLGEQLFSYPLKCVISVARIIVRQTGAYRTKIQIPLFGGSYNYELEEYNNYPYDYPIGYQTFDNFTPSDSLGSYIHDGVTSVWRFSAGELNSVSRLVFSPSARGAIFTETSKTFYVSATSNFIHFHYMLYSTTAVDIARDDATPALWVSETTVHTDNISGLVYTPIPDSYIEWDVGADPYPFSYTVYPDLSGLGTGTHRIAVGGELYIGLPVENQWKHWQTWFTVTIPSGYYIADAELRVFSTAQNQMTWELDYTLKADADLTLSLYDITAGSVVPGSELVWIANEEFSRKFAVLDPSDLVDGHEYRLGVEFVDIPDYAEVMDAQLLININPIYRLTIWQRCLSRWNDAWDNWTIPNAWGSDYWADPSHGSINVSPRVKFWMPDGVDYDVYFEVTGWQRFAYAVGQENYMRVWLEDMGDPGFSGLTGVDVAGSLIQWSEDIEETHLRKRSGPLTLTVGNEYGNRMPDIEYSMFMSNGFLIIRVR